VPSNGVIFVAATNRANLLDPALTRAGRFDRVISVPRPDAAGRHAILKVRCIWFWPHVLPLPGVRSAS
jgi:ATP-dependent Zn protease